MSKENKVLLVLAFISMVICIVSSILMIYEVCIGAAVVAFFTSLLYYKYLMIEIKGE